MSKANNRIGEIFIHPKYGEYYIIKYNNCEDVKIKFTNTGYEYSTSYFHAKNLEVSDLLYRGKYGTCKGTREVDVDAYKIWYNMVYRCNCNDSYKEATVCEQWMVFEPFLEWYKHQAKGDGWHLDKDILSNGRSVYSPTTCCFLPPEINTFFEKHKKAKGYSFNKKRKKFESYCRHRGRYIHLGLYDEQSDARDAYLSYKRKILEEIVKPYLSIISTEVYEAMKDFLWSK